MKKFNLFLSTLIFTILFVSCTNGILESSDGTDDSYSVRCSISQNLDESNMARTAFPSSTGVTFSYKVYYNCGTEAYNLDVQDYDGSDFSIKVPHKGLWELRVYGAENEIPVSSTEYILKSEKIYYLNVSDENPSPFQKIIVKPVMTSGVTTGSISIQVEWNDDTGITDAECICPELSTLQDFSFTQSGTTARLIAFNVPSASYTVDFNFYQEEGDVKILKYNATETINVYDGFTTDTWVKHGDDEHLNDSDAHVTFEVTKELTKKFINKTVYVDPSFDGNATGTWLAPYKSLDEARAFISSKLSDLGEITLILKGSPNTSGGETIYELDSSFNKDGLLFAVSAGEKLTVKSWDASKPVTITNKSGNRGFFNSRGTLKLENIILDGTSTVNEDGSRFESGAITSISAVELTNVTIRNFTVMPENERSNMGSGAALRITGGTATLNGLTVSDCKAVKGVNMATGCGGAMSITDGTITLSNSSIDSCAATYGGAINLYGFSTLTLENVTISGCTANLDGGGGAINVNSGTLKIKGNTIIKNNRLSDNTLNNIELATGIFINISETGAESRIGITKVFADGDSKVQFASDTTADISTKYFSDAEYLIVNSSGAGYIAKKSSGDLGTGIYEDVKFAADKTGFFAGEGASNITFSATVGTVPVALENWNATVTYAGMDITSRVTKTVASDKKSYKIVLPSDFPEGKYYITVRGDYNGLSYSGNEIISISAPRFIYLSLSDENIASVNMEKYAGKEMTFIIDGTVSLGRLKTLTAKIDTSSAKVTLDLSSANLSDMTSRGIIQRNVVKVILPDNLSSISGSYSLFTDTSYISDVEEFEISSNNTNYCVENGILYNKSKTEIVCYPPAKKEESFTTSDSVTSIGKYGIAYNRYLKTLVLSKVTDINDYACYKNTSLESCELYKGTNDGTGWTGGPDILNQYAFSECSALKTITIPATVWKFVGNCFTYCTSLESVTFLRTVGPTFYLSYKDCNEFEGCTSLKHIYVPRGAKAGYTTKRCSQYNTYWAGQEDMHWNYLSESGKLFEDGFVVEVD